MYFCRLIYSAFSKNRTFCVILLHIYAQNGILSRFIYFNNCKTTLFTPQTEMVRKLKAVRQTIIFYSCGLIYLKKLKKNTRIFGTSCVLFWNKMDTFKEHQYHIYGTSHRPLRNFKDTR